MTELIAGIKGYHPHLPKEKSETQKVTGLPVTLQPRVIQPGGADRGLDSSSFAPELLPSLGTILCPLRQVQKCQQSDLLHGGITGNRESCVQ